METKEQKIQRLREERDKKIASKKTNHFALDKKCLIDIYRPSQGVLLHVDMIVKVKKPDGTWRRGFIEYIKLDGNTFPKIGVICGKVRFEKDYNEVRPDNRMDEIMEMEGIEISERLKKLNTKILLKEYRKLGWRKYEKEGLAYKKELYSREHIGATGKKEMKEFRKEQIKSGKRK